MALAFPEADLAPLAWVALVPLLLTARHTSFRRGSALGLVFGIAFFGALLSWISLVGWLAWGLLVALQALFIALYGGIWSRLSRLSSPAGRVALAASLWVGLEYLRSMVPLGGFPWGQLSQSQHDLPWMLRSASVAGGWGTTLIVASVNALVAEAVLSRRPGGARRALVLGGVALGALALPTLVPSNSALGPSLRVAIVQGNVPLSFGGSIEEKQQVITRSHERLTEGLAGQSLDLVVWPESSVELDAFAGPGTRRALRRAAKATEAPMIVGGNIAVGTDRYKVVAFKTSELGRIESFYQKLHLVPFGEYVPARSLLGWIPLLDQVPKDAIAGDSPRLFRIAGGAIAAVISFEGDFGSLVRRPMASGGRLLVVVTNTSTWGESWASAQHVAFSQVRAAENGVWVAHAALSGISAFIDPTGKAVAATPLWETATRVRELRFAESSTLYTRTGDWLPAAAIIFSVTGLAWSWRSANSDSAELT